MVFKGGAAGGGRVSLVLFLAAFALGGCASQVFPVPPVPSKSQQELMLSRAIVKGSSGDEYRRLGVRFRAFIPPAEWYEVIQACLTQASAAATPESSPTHSQSLADRIEGCDLQFPLTVLKSALRTPAEWAYEFAYLGADFEPCLRAHDVTADPLPSRAAYLRDARDFNPPDPFEGVSIQLTSPRGEVLQRQCPADAPGLGP